MIILKNIEQIIDLCKKTIKDGVDSNIDLFSKIIDSKLADSEIDVIANSIKDLSNESLLIEDFSSITFQLRNPIPFLRNIILLLLKSKNYICVFDFTSKLFMGNIGLIKYQSDIPLNFTERNFDKFVEIIKNCDIETSDYLPLIVSACSPVASSRISEWKRPALEYLRKLFLENQKEIVGIISDADLKYEILKAIANISTQKGVEILLDDYLTCDAESKFKNLQILKSLKKDALPALDRRYAFCDELTQIKLLEIFFDFLPDNEIVTRLKDIYNTSNSDIVKSRIANELGITETLALKTEKQFLYAVRRKMKDDVQERALGVPFDRINMTFVSGATLEDAEKSFIIFLFKEEKNLINLKKLIILKNYITNESLTDFASKMFTVLSRKEDILSAKWAIRLFCLFSDASLDKEIGEFMFSLYAENRIKEARYLTDCLIAANKTIVLEIIKLLCDINQEYMVENKDLFASEYAKANNISKEEVYDELIPEQINKSTIAEQTNRLFDVFLSARYFNAEKFDKLFFKNDLLRPLAERLVWGEYNFNRLYNAFIVKNGQKKYLVKTSEIENPQITIIHGLDLDYRFDSCLNAIANPLFTQFRMSYFDMANFSKLSVTVNRFTGMFVNVEPFLASISAFGFTKNMHPDENVFDSLVLKNTGLNLICEICFEKTVTNSQQFATIGQIYFYKIDDVVFNNERYITQKSNAMSLGAVPYRFFDFILNSISEAGKNR